jgi:hypothetical protein
MAAPLSFEDLGLSSSSPSTSLVDHLEKRGLIPPENQTDSQLEEWRSLKHRGKLSDRRHFLSNPAIAKILSHFPPPRGPFELYQSGVPLLRSTIQVEIEWLCLILEANAKVISDYAAIRNEVDVAVFEGREGEARQRLDSLIARFGWSFSALDRHIMLLAKAEKHDDLSKLFSNTIASAESPLQKFVTAAFIYKNNPVVPAKYFDKLFESNLKLVQAPEMIRALLRLLIQSPDHLDSLDEKDISALVLEVSCLPLFDAYEFILALLQCRDFSKIPDQRIIGAFKSLRRHIQDPRLEQFFVDSGEGIDHWMVGRRFLLPSKRGSNVGEILNLIFQGDGNQSFLVLHNWLKSQPRSPLTIGLDALALVFSGDRTLDNLNRFVVRFDPSLKRSIDLIAVDPQAKIKFEDFLDKLSQIYQGRRIFEILYFCRTAAAAAIFQGRALMLSLWIIKTQREFPVAFEALKGDKDISEFLGLQQLNGIDDLPILVAFSFVCESLMEVSIRIEEFLDSQGASNPSDLFELVPAPFPEFFDLFIVNVCTFDQLQHLPSVGETEGDVISERISLLHQIETDSEPLRNKIDIEVSKLVKLERLRSMARIVEESRLRVDTSSLIKKLRYFYEDDEIWKESQRKEFSDLHQHMLGLFLLDEDHGLDTELSGRIRHGKLSERLLSPFLSNHLLIEGKEAIAIDQFGGRAIAEEPDALRKATDILREFSQQTTKYVEDFSNERAQLKIIDISWQGFPGLLSAKSAPKGLICVSTLRETSFLNFKSQLEKAPTKEDVETVFELVINSIWDALEVQLAKIREVISEEVKTSLAERLSQVEETIKNILPPISHDPFHRCRSQIEQVCDEVSKWFVKPAAETFPSSKFEDIFELSVRAIEISRWGAFTTSVDPTVGSLWINATIGGEVYELLLLLLTNAGKHGSREEGRRFAVYRDPKDSRAVFFSNLCDTEVTGNVDEACDLITKALQGGNNEALNREGKSGFRKMIRQLRKISGGSDFGITAIENGGEFCVRISAEFLRHQ